MQPVAATRSIPGLDDGGFIAYPALKATARRLALDAFLKVFPVPALHLFAVAPPTAGDIPELGDPRERSFRSTGTSDAGDAPRYHDKVGFLTKRPGNPFPDLVSLGRAMNNDIAVDLGTVSKAHGYFRRDGANWFYEDHESTNGTTLDGTPMKAGERRVLRDGARLGLGPFIVATFLDPTTLHARARVYGVPGAARSRTLERPPVTTRTRGLAAGRTTRAGRPSSSSTNAPGGTGARSLASSLRTTGSSV
jgi:hypothetical protein